MARILVAEDDPKQSRLVVAYLQRDGHEALVAHDGRAALELARQRKPDLVILDVMMPNMDGLDVCRVLRMESDVPIIMLTARSTEDDLLLGLDLGADDYVTKPYSPRELMGRVKAALRRGRASRSTPSEPLCIGALEIDPDRAEVRLDGEVVELTPREGAILETLATVPGKVFSRQELLERAHGFDTYSTTRTIDVHVMNLRRKIEPDPASPRYVHTVKGRGYKLAEPE